MEIGILARGQLAPLACRLLPPCIRDYMRTAPDFCVHSIHHIRVFGERARRELKTVSDVGKAQPSAGGGPLTFRARHLGHCTTQGGASAASSTWSHRQHFGGPSMPFSDLQPRQ